VGRRRLNVRGGSRCADVDVGGVAKTQTEEVASNITRINKTGIKHERAAAAAAWAWRGVSAEASRGRRMGGHRMKSQAAISVMKKVRNSWKNGRGVNISLAAAVMRGVNGRRRDVTRLSRIISKVSNGRRHGVMFFCRITFSNGMAK